MYAETVRVKRTIEKNDKIKAVLSEFCDLKRLNCLLAPRKSNGIIEIRDKEGNLKHDKGDIAEVFALFYESRDIMQYY